MNRSGPDMAMGLSMKLAVQAKRFWARLRTDRRGVSAVEFALIAPVMIVILFGVIEISMLMTADRKVTRATSAIADLVAQDDIITADEMTDIFTATGTIMQPYDANGMQMRVSSVVMANDGSVAVDWSEAQSMSARAPGSSVSVPAGILQPNSSIVMAEVRYNYSSNLGTFLSTPILLKETFYLRPRRALKVTGP
jgi:Flp pilus assembly protein TadG